jgi:hypothetical protein
MKKFLMGLSVAAAVAAASVAQAVNIGGLDVSVGAHFEVASVYENPVFVAGQELKGYGEVTQINGVAISSLCAGCELTYRFTGYTTTALNSPNPGAFAFSGGLVQFYLGFGADNDFNPFASASSAADLAAATNGTLFLTLQGHAIDAAGNTLSGSGSNIGTSGAAGNGSGLLDVVMGGGIASANFNTNSILALFGTGNADMQLGSSFSPLLQPHAAECAAGILDSCLAGSADLRGLVIPVPAVPALLGLGLVAFGLAKRNRKA